MDNQPELGVKTQRIPHFLYY